MLQRISAAIAAGRRAAAAGEAVPTPGDAPVSPVQPAWALVHLGDPAGIEPRLEAHLSTCRARRLRCLLVSDDIPQTCVGSREILFEFLPWPADSALTTPGGFAAASDHTFRRLSQILTFWQVLGCNWEGTQARELLEMAPDRAHPIVRAAQRGQATPSHIQERVLDLR
jgi:hypothetical protein